METLKTDVLIIGAGPTGLSLAAQLIRYGINFIIVDEKAGPTGLSKALVVHARTLEIFDQLGLATAAVKDGQVARKAVLLHNGAVSTEIEFGEFGEGLSPFPFVLIYEQSKTEKLLYRHLQQAGTEVSWNTQLLGLTQTETGTTATLKTLTGTTQTVQAGYVVGADGARSPVRHLLSLGFDGSTHARTFYVADVDMDFAAEPATLHISFRENFYLLAVPMQGAKRWRLIGNLPDDTGPTEQAVPYAEIEAQAKYVLQRPVDITRVHWFSTYKVHTRHAERFSVGRCFLVGDAAHVHTPAGGQGMNTGIQDAYNLAWKLALALRGRAHPRLLDTYNEERLANAQRLLASTDDFFKAAMSDRRAAHFIRDHIVPGVLGFLSHFGLVRERIFPSISQTGITYRAESLSEHAGDASLRVKSGDRMPHFMVNGTSVYEQLKAPAFHLILFTNEPASYKRWPALLADKYGDALDVTVLPLMPQDTEVFGSYQPFMVLLRPDNYIGLITQQVGMEQLDAYLINTIGYLGIPAALSLEPTGHSS